MIGETVAVFGLGVVGLLTTSLLSAFPLGGLAAWDRYALRRTVGLECGADLCLEPAEGQDALVEFLRSHGSPDGFDLVYEISGAPEALDQALEVAGFGARVVIGSWYGSKRASLDLGGRFHRSRIQLLASQVSTLAPELSARWTKSRRLETAWNALASVRPERWVTHRFPFAQAGEAFRHIAGHLGETLQVVLTYD